MLGFTRQAVRDLVRRGRLPRHPVGGVRSAPCGRRRAVGGRPGPAARPRRSPATRGAAMINDRLIDGGELPLARSEEHTSELQSRRDLVCRLLLEKKKKMI